MTEPPRGKPDVAPPSRHAVSAPKADGEQPDVEAFLRQPRLSLTDEYWRPLDSLAPVRFEDMRDEKVPTPSSRRRVRVLDVVIALVGVGAALLLVVLLRRGDGQPKAHVAQGRTELRAAPVSTAAKHAAATAAAGPALPVAALAATTPPRSAEATTVLQTPPEATAAIQATTVATSAVQAPVEGTSAVQAPAEATVAVPAAAEAPTAAQAGVAPTSAASDDKTPSTSAAAMMSTSPSAAASASAASAMEPTHAKKRRHKKADHAPPTASFPDP